jgi:hypothetical protein
VFLLSGLDEYTDFLVSAIVSKSGINFEHQTSKVYLLLGMKNNQWGEVYSYRPVSQVPLYYGTPCDSKHLHLPTLTAYAKSILAILSVIKQHIYYRC